MRLTRAQAAAQEAAEAEAAAAAAASASASQGIQIHTDETAESIDEGNDESNEVAESASLNDSKVNAAENEPTTDLETAKEEEPKGKVNGKKATKKGKKKNGKAQSAQTEKEMTAAHVDEEDAGDVVADDGTFTPDEEVEEEIEEEVEEDGAAPVALDMEPAVEVTHSPQPHAVEEAPVLEDAEDESNNRPTSEESQSDKSINRPTPEEPQPHEPQPEEAKPSLLSTHVESGTDSPSVEPEDTPSDLLSTNSEPQTDATSVDPEQKPADLLSASFDLEAESPSVEPEDLVLFPQRTPAKNLIAKEVSTMRSTSNKENEQPFANSTVQEPEASLPSIVSVEDPAETIDTSEGAAEESLSNGESVVPTGQVAQQSSPAPAVSPVKPKSSSSRPSTRPSTKPLAKPTTLRDSASIRTKTASPKAKPALSTSASIRSKNLSSKPDTPSKRPLSTNKPLARPSTVRNNLATKATESSKPSITRDKAPASIPHSKPRPISLSFPTPPPPPKSTKAPTKSTFQLPGEAVAAKLKAAREERTKKEQEARANPSADIPRSKARPTSLSFPAPPKSTKPPTKANFQLPGEAVAAKLKAAKEERLKKEQEEGEKRRAFKARPAPKPKQGPPAVVRQTASSRARESIMLGKPSTETTAPEASTTANEKARSVRASTTKPRASTVTSRLSTVPKAPSGAIGEKSLTSALTVNKRHSIASPQTAKPRTSLATTAAAQRTTSTNNGTKRGKEVFQRAAAEKDTLDKQKREKEAAAKKARLDAAERGRIASREWAEKMKLKSQKAKPTTAAVQQDQVQKTSSTAAEPVTSTGTVTAV